jgi:NAD(P)-dependent dehydrogenase (short-subunit alcohol dehydrogenase family)
VDQLAGRTAVVTGAASGLGLAMAERFAALGMRLALADIDPGVHEVATRLSAGGGEAHALVTDVSNWADVEGLAEFASNELGPVHVVCNNAGVVKRARAWELTLEDWTWVLGVDLLSVVYGIRAFLPRMLAHGEGGHVVNTASMAGLLPFPNLAAYSVAKHGVVALSESLQLDLIAEGSDIGVSVLCPGFIGTRITDSARNRPASLANTAAASAAGRTTASAQPRMDAAEVAEQVVDAIRAQRFWILTHSEYRPVIQERAAAVGTDLQPTPPPVW